VAGTECTVKERREGKGGVGRGREQGQRGGSSQQTAERHAFLRQTGPQRAEAASTQGTGLMRRLPKEKGGGVPHLAVWV